MSDWLYSLPIAWRALVVFGITYLVAAAIQVLVAVFSVGEGAHSFEAITPGILAPLGAIFALFVGLTIDVGARIWSAF